jgi:hypothetical protein
MGAILADGLGLITWGVVLACAALLLLGEYRKVFFENPGAVMTFEVWAKLFSDIGGPGYLASLLLIAAVLFIIAGLGTLFVTLAVTLGWR